MHANTPEQIEMIHLSKMKAERQARWIKVECRNDDRSGERPAVQVDIEGNQTPGMPKRRKCKVISMNTYVVHVLDRSSA